MALVVRHLRQGELPKPLLEFRAFPLDPAMVWVAEADGEVVGALMATANHGMFFPWRLKVEDNAPPATAFRLIRQSFREARQRGCMVAAILLDLGKAPELRLAKACEKFHGIFIPMQLAVAVALPLQVRFFQ